MSKDARFVPDKGAVRAFLKSGMVEGLVRSQAEAVVRRAGKGAKASTWQGDSRVIGSVTIETNVREKSRVVTGKDGKKHRRKRQGIGQLSRQKQANGRDDGLRLLRALGGR
ncbi:hypothetical protein [Arcanobacterium phocae]|uniref:hypothetical protein n=1 Tax=Arcanobacterium phocae TaxID=131112 RepID=UPI001C0E96E4|nr:hypothetical protein [Arcanobacterium phocae]